MIAECKNGEDYNKVIKDLLYKRIIYVDNNVVGIFFRDLYDCNLW